FWAADRPFRKGEDLEQRAVESNEVLFYEQVSGLYVFFHGQPENRAYPVVSVEGDPVPIPRQNKEDMEQQFMVAKAFKEAAPQKAMLDEGKPASNLSNTLMAENPFF